MEFDTFPVTLRSELSGRLHGRSIRMVKIFSYTSTGLLELVHVAM